MELLPTVLFSLVWIFSSVVAQYGFGPTQWNADPLNPPSLPLAVKGPYVNAWAPLGTGSAAMSNQWPRTWDTESNVRHRSYSILPLSSYL